MKTKSELKKEFKNNAKKYKHKPMKPKEVKWQIEKPSKWGFPVIILAVVIIITTLVYYSPDNIEEFKENKTLNLTPVEKIERNSYEGYFEHFEFYLNHKVEIKGFIIKDVNPEGTILYQIIDDYGKRLNLKGLEREEKDLFKEIESQETYLIGGVMRDSKYGPTVNVEKFEKKE